MTIEARKPCDQDKLAQFREITNIFPQVELACLGEIPVMYAGWGQHLTTEEMIARWRNDNTPDALLSTIRAYGVLSGFYFEEEHDRKSPEAREQSIVHMVAIAESLMRVRGWDHAQLRLATISEHPDIAQEVVSRLKDKRLDIDDCKFYGLACDGGGGAMIDAIADPGTQGKQMVFVAAENLNGGFVPRDNLAMSTLFGNGGGGTAFIPGKEISLVHPELVRAVVQRDDQQVIQIPREYDVDKLRQTHSPASPPPWYEVDPDANFLYSESGLVVNEITTAGEIGAMKGFETGLVFRNLVLPLIEDLLKKYYELYPDSANRIRLALVHQPSKTIFTNIARKLKNRFKDLCPEIPWFMEGTGLNNISSGNIFVAMTEAVKQNLLKSGDVFLLATFGIGLSAHGAIVQLMQQP